MPGVFFALAPTAEASPGRVDGKAEDLRAGRYFWARGEVN